jgi:7,8-dihydropterin-6-yl-methyl-4-(beta-D-ribofuranosyl)aminobenzene 5'-phosphate synthase
MSRITVLCENTATGKDLLAEHGLSFWIEHQGHTLLFDTGQGHVLKNNAQCLNISLDMAEALVLSHGHFDHTGTVSLILENEKSPKIYTHPAALAPRYTQLPDGSVREIGLPKNAERAIRQKKNLVWTEAPIEIFPGLFATGTIPRQTDFERSSGPFFVDRACRQPDEFPDDQALYFGIPQGTVVVLGCAHSGVINTLHYIQNLTDHRPIHLLIGGMHLVAASSERMDRTVEELRRLDVHRLMPAHCTGFPAMARLWQEFPERYTPCPVGTVIEIEESPDAP